MNKQFLFYILFATLISFSSSCIHPDSKQSAVLSQKADMTQEMGERYFETKFIGADKPFENKRDIAATRTISDYKIGTEMCGQGDLKFPRILLEMRKGYCAGIVAGRESGLIAPRSIVQIPNSPHFLLVDFGGWVRNNGRVILIERLGNEFKLRTLLEKLDYPHGLAIGPDGKSYVATQEMIFRFDPLAARPDSSVETIIRGLPGVAFQMPEGAKIEKSTHPLKQFVFDRDGAIYINIGGPSDACLKLLDSNGGCIAGEGARPTGAIWKYTPQSGKIFKTLTSTDANPPMQVIARGLRNSMALVVHPNYPQAGYAFLQGENGRDFPDPMQPNEELNSIEIGKHYGWPYCFNNESMSPEYVKFLSSNPNYKGLCKSAAAVAYRQPYSLFPPHSSPLGLQYYNSNRFPELRGTVLVTWHGYMSPGSRLAFAKVDEKGFPVKNTNALTFNQNCSSKKLIQTAEAKQVSGVQFEELISGWYGVSGSRPQGAPVGMTVADDGSIWVVEDKNASILRIDASTSIPPEPLACDSRTEEEILDLMKMIEANPTNRQRLTDIRKNLVERTCMKCHSDFYLKPEQSEDQRDWAVARYMLTQDSWLLPGNLAESRLHKRTSAWGFEKPMPDNAEHLLATDSTHRQAVATLDKLIGTIVPGEIYRVNLATAATLNLRDGKKTLCGVVPNQEIVLVVSKTPAEMPGFYRISRPPLKYIDQKKCDKNGKFYLGADFLIPVEVPRTPAAVTEELFKSQAFTKKGDFTFGIEGPAVAADGTLYVVNYKSQGTVGKINPDRSASELLKLPDGSIGNSLRISKSGTMFIADYKKHKVYAYNLKEKILGVLTESSQMSQPNDFTLAKDGSLFISDPNWKKRKGKIWHISPQGGLAELASTSGTANGIDLSSDEKTLYVGESNTNSLWAYPVADGKLGTRKLVKRFKGFEIDGLRTDTRGNIYVTRIGKGSVVKLSPSGEVLKEIILLGKDPTNLAFGGLDGKTVFVTQRDGGYIESFRVDEPGREWAMIQP
ncbi:MAG: SMP-30/gluconolactonase/LRE family protein [Bdellovibrionota bacterium]